MKSLNFIKVSKHNEIYIGGEQSICIFTLHGNLLKNYYVNDTSRILDINFNNNLSLILMSDNKLICYDSGTKESIESIISNCSDKSVIGYIGTDFKELWLISDSFVLLRFSI